MGVKFKIKRGLLANLPIVGEEGCWYLTTNTNELFVCMKAGEKPVKVDATGTFNPERVDALEIKVQELETKISDASSTKTYATYAELPNVGDESTIYIIKDENATYRWASVDGSKHYVCVGRDYTNVKVIDGGDATQFNN